MVTVLARLDVARDREAQVRIAWPGRLTLSSRQKRGNDSVSAGGESGVLAKSRRAVHGSALVGTSWLVATRESSEIVSNAS
jgi:hypothetical protein